MVVSGLQSVLTAAGGRWMSVFGPGSTGRVSSGETDPLSGAAVPWNMADTPPDAMICPRCGRPVVQRGVGRRRVWCSDDCRRRGHEHGVRVVTRTLTREIQRPTTPAEAVEIVLASQAATRDLLDQLADQWRAELPLDSEPQQRLHRLLWSDVLTRLWTAHHDRLGQPPPPTRPLTPVPPGTARLEGEELRPGLTRAQRRAHRRRRGGRRPD